MSKGVGDSLSPRRSLVALGFLYISRQVYWVAHPWSQCFCFLPLDLSNVQIPLIFLGIYRGV